MDEINKLWIEVGEILDYEENVITDKHKHCQCIIDMKDMVDIAKQEMRK